MIESAYALSKFIDAVNKHMPIGRVDLAGSLGLSRKEIDSPRMAELVTVIFGDARKHSFGTTLGGSIEAGSRPLIENLVANNLLDRFETRKVVFDAKRGLESFDEAVRSAHQLELLWLENKSRMHTHAAEEDASRITMLRKRVQQ